MNLIELHSDTTTRFSCRAGDFMLWLRSKNLFSSEVDLQVIDIWQLKDGDSVLITNRWQDLPTSFDLHPLETSGSAVYWMQKRLDAGHQPEDPVEGPNIWRALCGDRLAWVGKARPDINANDGVLRIIDFRSNALVWGEPIDLSLGMPHFGGFLSDSLLADKRTIVRAGFKAAEALGMPRAISAHGEWRLGA